jgi:hypothetical protein
MTSAVTNVIASACEAEIRFARAHILGIAQASGTLANI